MIINNKYKGKINKECTIFDQSAPPCMVLNDRIKMAYLPPIQLGCTKIDQSAGCRLIKYKMAHLPPIKMARTKFIPILPYPTYLVPLQVKHTLAFLDLFW